MESAKGLGQRDTKGDTKACFLFESWVSSDMLAEAVMGFGAEIIVMVKTNTKVFCNETIENLKKDCPGGSYLVLRIKSVVPREMPLIAISYKYNAWKVLSLIYTEDTGNSKEGITYLSRYPELFANVAIFSVARPLVISKFFGYINEVGFHKNSRQSDLAQENYWVAQFGWLRLCAIV